LPGSTKAAGILQAGPAGPPRSIGGLSVGSASDGLTLQPKARSLL